MRTAWVGENVVNYIKMTYEGLEFWMMCGKNGVTSFASQTAG
jgi:hypothetical protein